jgi:hypothetical protein
MPANLKNSLQIWWSTFSPKARQALAASYGWKYPVERTQRGSRSPVLYLLALLFFMLRLLWPLQFIKLLIRINNPTERTIHPAWTEGYLLCSLFLGLIAVTCANFEIWLFNFPAWLILFLVIWKVADTVTNNLYYLLFRPIFDQTPPHNTYRSLILALLSLIECWIWLSLVWYYVAITEKPFESVVAALYFTTQFFLTGGDGGYTPTGAISQWLAIFTTFTALAMMVVVLGRAIGIIRPPPS